MYEIVKLDNLAIFVIMQNGRLSFDSAEYFGIDREHKESGRVEKRNMVFQRKLNVMQRLMSIFNPESRFLKVKFKEQLCQQTPNGYLALIEKSTYIQLPFNILSQSVVWDADKGKWKIQQADGNVQELERFIEETKAENDAIISADSSINALAAAMGDAMKNPMMVGIAAALLIFLGILAAAYVIGPDLQLFATATSALNRNLTVFGSSVHNLCVLNKINCT